MPSTGAVDGSRSASRRSRAGRPRRPREGRGVWCRSSGVLLLSQFAEEAAGRQRLVVAARGRVEILEAEALTAGAIAEEVGARPDRLLAIHARLEDLRPHEAHV